MRWFFWQAVLLFCLFLQNPCLGQDLPYDGTESLMQRSRTHRPINRFVAADLVYQLPTESAQPFDLADDTLSLDQIALFGDSDADATTDNGAILVNSPSASNLSLNILSDTIVTVKEEKKKPLASREFVTILGEENVVTDRSYVDFIQRIDAAYLATRYPFPDEGKCAQWTRKGIGIIGGLGAGAALCGTFMAVSADDLHLPVETYFATAAIATVFPMALLCYSQQFAHLIRRFSSYCKKPQNEFPQNLIYNHATLGRRIAKAAIGASSLFMTCAHFAQLAYYQGEENLWFTSSAGPFYALLWFDMLFTTGSRQVDKDFNRYKSPDHPLTPILHKIMVGNTKALEDILMQQNEDELKSRVDLLENQKIVPNKTYQPFKLSHIMAKLEDQRDAALYPDAQWANLRRYLQAFRKEPVRYRFSDSLMTMVMGVGTYAQAVIISHFLPMPLEWFNLNSSASRVVGIALAPFTIPITYGHRDVHLRTGRRIVDTLKSAIGTVIKGIATETHNNGASSVSRAAHNMCMRVTAAIPTVINTAALTMMTVSMGMKSFEEYPLDSKALFITSASMLTASAAYSHFGRLSKGIVGRLTAWCQSDATKLRIRLNDASCAATTLIKKLNDRTSQTLFWVLMGGTVKSIKNFGKIVVED